MNKSHRFLVSILLLGAYLLSACSGAAPLSAPQQDDSSSASQSAEVVFTGNVEAMGASQWTISGQVIGVEGASIDANIQVGDIVKVEASVMADGSIFALRIEAVRPASVDDNANGDMNGNTNDDMNGNANDNMNGNANDDMNGNANESPDDEQEIYGVVEALASDSITVSGVTYTIASFTEFKTIVSVGDQVKLHVVVASDGALVVREIERTSSASDDDNSNGNQNSNDDDDDDNSNSNSNDNDDDDSNGNQNSNGDDDDDNSNSNSNDNDDDDDDNDNSNGNSNSNDNDDD
jgi:hypothetical protein